MLSPNTTLSLLSVRQHFALEVFQFFLKNCKQTTFSQDLRILIFCKLNRLFFRAIKIKNCQFISFSSLNFLHVRVSPSCKIKRFLKILFLFRRIECRVNVFKKFNSFKLATECEQGGRRLRISPLSLRSKAGVFNTQTQHP